VIAIILCSCNGYNQTIENGNQMIKKIQMIENSSDTTLIAKYAMDKLDSLGLNLKRIPQKYQPQENTFFYVIKDAPNGKVLAYKYVPYIESGDFSVVIYHYFDEEGKTIAHKKRIRFVNAVCSEDVLVQDDTNYYDSKGQLVKSIVQFTDSSGKDMSGKSCVVNYSFKAKVYKRKSEIPFSSRL
jgi:hypothetical protein